MRSSGVSSPTRLAIRAQNRALMTEAAILVAALVSVEPYACPNPSDLASGQLETETRAWPAAEVAFCFLLLGLLCALARETAWAFGGASTF